MACEVMKLKSLHKLDEGKVALIFDRALAGVVQDCLDRPADGSKRTVELIVTVSPKGEGVCDAVNIEFACKSKIPSRRTRVYEMAPKGNGALIVNLASDDDAHQQTLDEDGGAASQD